MTTLVLTSRLPRSRLSGYDLRVFSLCGFLEPPIHLAVFPTDATEDDDVAFPVESLFASLHEINATADRPPSPLRHFRLSNSNFLHLSQPELLRSAAGELSSLIRRLAVSRTIVFGTGLAELAYAARSPNAILDICDSVALTIRRELDLREPDMTLAGRIRMRTQLMRAQRCEAVLPTRFPKVTTINKADSEEVARLSRGAGSNIYTVPNGVDAGFLAPMGKLGTRRGVAFWGNLSFSPNRAAMRHFFTAIYIPYLRQAGVTVRIIGKAAEDWLLELARNDPQIELLGYVEDLPRAIADFPILVNPMVIGSGLKNKVLEAFGLGLAVVSTPLGVEAFPEATPGKHFLLADKAEAFASSVLTLLDQPAWCARLRAEARTLLELHYRWESIGARWRALCADNPGDG
jgi:glycosyltransferase involved in cell wall biosynthesis